MAGFERGINSGVDGLISISGSPKFYGKCYGFARELTAQVQQFWGRGDDEWGDPRFVAAAGTMLVRFIVQPGIGHQLPTTWNGATGNIQLTYGKNSSGNPITETVSVMVISHKILRDDGGSKGNAAIGATDGWHGTMLCSVLDVPTEANFTGTQPTFTSPNYADKLLYEGLTKTYDSNQIIDGATETWLMWPVTDSNAAEITEITTFISGASDPMSRSLKLGPPTLERFNNNAVKIRATWERNDTKDKIEKPQSPQTRDDNILTRNADVCLVTGSADPDPTRPTLSGYVYRNVTTTPINPSRWQHVYHFGTKDTQQDVTFPLSITLDDQSDLVDEIRITEVQASTTPTPPLTPTAMVLDDIEYEQLTDSTAGNEWRYTFIYRRRTKQEAIEYDGSPNEYDPSSIFDSYRVTLIRANGTYSPPAAVSGYVASGRAIITQIHNQGGTKWKHVYEYARVSNVDRLSFAGRQYTLGSVAMDSDTAKRLGEVSRIRIVSTDPDPQTTEPDPSTDGPNGATLYGKVVKVETQPLTSSQGSYTGYWQHDYIIAPNTVYDEIVNQGSFEDDPADWSDTETIKDTAVGSTFPATPTPSDADQKLVAKSRRRIAAAGDVWEFTWRFGRMTETDKRQLKRRSVDPDSIGYTEEIPVVATSRTVSPGTPAQIGTASNLVETVVEDLVTANGSFTGLFLWLFRFGPLTKKKAIELGETINQQDPSTLEAVKVITKIEATEGSPASEPGGPAGMVLFDVITEQLQDSSSATKWKNKYIYKYRTREDEEEFGASKTQTDASGLASEIAIAVIQASDTPPSTPSGYSLYETLSKQRTSAPLYLFVYVYRLLTRKEEREHEGTFAQRSYFEASVGTFYVQAQIKTCTDSDTVETLLATELIALEAVTTRAYFQARVQKLNKTNYLLSIWRPNDDKAVERSRCDTRREEKEMEPTGQAVLVGGVRNNGTQFVLSPWDLMVVRQISVLRRYIRTTDITLATKQSTEGKRHSGTNDFIGRPQYTMLFLGGKVVFNWATEPAPGSPTQNRWYCVDFMFEYSSIGHYQSTIVPMGVWLPTPSSVTVTAGSSYLAATLGLQGNQQLAQPAADGGDFNTIFG